MFATCIFCHSSLGANESIEHFPVGKRLAFDAAKGRLWVVCPTCERWNLSPLEDRWEAIEDAERLYRDTSKRVATDHIGLAQLQDGTQLIRIGEPLRPEFAAWRYGDQFGRRRNRQLMIGGGGSAILLTAMIGTPLLLGVAVGTAVMGFQVINAGNILYQKFVPKVRVVDGTGRILSVSGADIGQVRLSLRGDDSRVHVQFPYREWSTTGPMLRRLGIKERPNASRLQPAHLDGDVALRALALLLPAINGSGGSAKEVNRAVEVVENHRNSTHDLLKTAINAIPGWVGPKGKTAGNLPKALRLALEMSLHEEDERRALEGELHELEQRWKDAEQIAAIADALTLPENFDARIDSLRKAKAD